MLQSRSPALGVELFEDPDQTRSDDAVHRGVDILQHVESDGVLAIRRIEDDDVIGTVAGDIVEDVIGEITVRIDDRYAFARLDIGEDHVVEQGGFAHAGLTDDIDMPTTILRTDTKELVHTAVVGLTERGHRNLLGRVGQIDGWFELFARYPVDVGRFDLDVGQVKDCRQLLSTEYERLV